MMREANCVTVSDEELLDIDKVPAKYLSAEPRITTLEGIRERAEYYEYWLTRTEKQRLSKAYAERILNRAEAAGYADKWAVLDTEMKILDAHAKAFKKKLDETAQAQANFHYCPCCGLPTSATPPGQVGPDCAKPGHKFPCRRRSA
jgi:rubrerythrin